MYALGTAVVGMLPDLLRFPHLDRGARDVGGPEDYCVLDGGHDADVERHLPAVDPVTDEDVGWTRKRTGDDARHFLQRVETRALCLIENVVPNPVVSAAPNAVVVTAVHCMVAVSVFFKVAVGGRARSRLNKVNAEAVGHHGSERAGVEMKVESVRRDPVAPVSGMRKGKRVKTGLISCGGGGEELRAGVSVNGGREGVLGETRR